MDSNQFNRELRDLADRALASKDIDVLQIIGSFTLAISYTEEKARRAMAEAQAKHLSKNIVLPPNGIHLPPRS